MLLLSSASFFFKMSFFKTIFYMDTIRLSNDLDPDQNRRTVGPNLDPNGLQSISVDDKSRFLQGKS